MKTASTESTLPAENVGPIVPHSPIDDSVALTSAAILVALGIVFLEQAQLVTGGTAGLALLASYRFGMPFGIAFLLINIPFLVLGWKQFGPGFIFRTGLVVVLVSGITGLHQRWLAFEPLQPVWVALTGGLLVGVGLLILFRHRGSLGGFNVLVLWLQERFGWRAGWVQLALDVAILLLSLTIVDPWTIVWSLIGVTALNVTLAINHRPGRYMAV